MRRPALLLLASYLILTALPLLPLLAGHSLPRWGEVLVIEAAAWPVIWAIFGRPARFHWLLLPAMLAAPAEAWLLYYYDQGISAHHLGIIAETNPAEALAFLGWLAWLLPAVGAAALGWWWLTLRAARAAGWQMPRAWRLRVLAAAVTAAVVWLANRDSFETTEARPQLGSVAKATLPFEVAGFARSWPFGILARGGEFLVERRYLATLAERTRNFRFGAHQAAPDAAPETVVLVLGESARFDRFGINGYARDTTPLLGRESNLVSFQDVVTPLSATRQSLPLILTRTPARIAIEGNFDERSLVSAFHEAGFKTWWISNQQAYSVLDTAVSVFAREADVERFVNLGSQATQSSMDGALIAPFRDALADPAPKKLLVVHMMGSHWHYGERYPDAFDRWKPSLHGHYNASPTDYGLRTELGNSYDNSILYTDWVLAQLIGSLRTAGGSAAFLYVSDHGQTLYDNNCPLIMHGHNSQYEQHVPAIAWYSDAYAARYPAKAAQLKVHREAPLSTENVFHTLLDLGDIRFPGSTPDWSAADPRLAPHTRFVRGTDWIDYDRAKPTGACRAMIE